MGSLSAAVQPKNGEELKLASNVNIAIDVCDLGKHGVIGLNDKFIATRDNQKNTSSNQDAVKIWDLELKECVCELVCDSIFSVVISFDGKFMVTNHQKKIKLWSLESRVCIEEFEYGIRGSVAITTDGIFVASCSGEMIRFC
jgi:WD40 repeat protein